MNNFVYKFEKKLYINLTNRCSNNCTFCLRNNGDEVGGYYLWLEREPTAEEVIELLKKEDLKKYPEVVFCGYGEPTYRIDEINKIGTYLKSKSAFTRLDTNGQGNLINGYNIVEKLVNIIDKVSISLNQYNAQEYDKICLSEFGEKGFDAMIDFAVMCKNSGIKTRFTLVDVIDEEDKKKCQSLAKTLDIDLDIRSYIE
jgi:TatD family-associated radical SAM protein